MKIKNIRKITEPSGTYYDLSIAKNHTFFVNGVLTHNCNLPARNVIVVGVTRGPAPVHEMDVIQMSGRAGRYGIDPEGDCYLLCDHEAKWREKVANPLPVTSTLLQEDILGFHVLAEVAIGEVWDKKTLMGWFNRSLARIQQQAINEDLAERVVQSLLKWGMLKLEANGHYAVTPLGRVSVDLYFPPRDVLHWAITLQEIADHNAWTNDTALALAIGGQPSRWEGFIRAADRDRVAYFQAIARRDCPYLRTEGIEALVCDVKDYLTEDHRERTAVAVRSIVMDIDRLLEAYKRIGRLRHFGADSVWSALATRLRYGVKAELVPLCQISHIGRKRARELFEKGVRTPNDILERPDTVKAVMMALAYKVMTAANEFVNGQVG